jgi:O-antigen/teichoic acid export membrane protein
MPIASNSAMSFSDRDDAASARATVSRNIAWSYANWAISILAPLISVPFYVRLLGHDLYGQWLVILSLTQYLGLADLGMAQTVGNRIAQALANGRRNLLGSLVSTTVFTYAAITAVVCAIAAAATPWFARHYLPGGHTVADAFLLYVVLSAASFPLKAYQMALRGFERVDQEQAIEAGSAAARAAIVIAALAAGAKLLAVAFINGASALVAAAVACWMALRLEPLTRPRLAGFSMRLLREMARPSCAFFALQIGFTLTLGVDNLVIGYALGAAAVTRYAVSFRLMWIAVGMFSAAITALTPTVTANYARDQRGPLREGFLLSMRLAILYAGAGAILLWFVGPSFIRAWAGPGVMPARATYALQLVVFVTRVLLATPAMILWATTRHQRWAAITICEGVLNLALSLWWIRYWGASGVIGATVAATLATNCWFVPFAALRTLGLSCAQAARELRTGVALLTLALGGIFALPRIVAPAASAALMAAAVTFALLFVAVYARLVFDNIQRRMVFAWLAPTFK